MPGKFYVNLVSPQKNLVELCKKSSHPPIDTLQLCLPGLCEQWTIFLYKVS